MPTYMTLLNYTDQGIRNIKESPKRLDSTKRALEKLGGAVKAFYLTQGNYDGVLILEAPSEEALTKFLLTIGAAGNVRTNTLRAYTEEEFRKHIAALSPN
jgi:uncharacterized protein with GYD domain